LISISGPYLDITEASLEAKVENLATHEKEMLRDLRDAEGMPFTDLRDLFELNCHLYKISNATGYTRMNSLLPLLSRFNHSCLPNGKVESIVTASDPEGTHVFTAVKEITQGQEITFCYDPLYKFMPSSYRRELMRRFPDFECQCMACQPGTTFNELSDLRRQLLRGIQFLISGENDPLDFSPLEVPQLRLPAEPSTFVQSIVQGLNPAGYNGLIWLRSMVMAAEGLAEQ